jgi:ubiquinone biosynthesis protein
MSFKYLSRYKDLAWFLIKYGRSDLIKQIGIESPIVNEQETTENVTELVKDLQTLGPTFIKLGQFLSTQADFVSESYQEALSTLQDRVDPFPFEEVEKIIAEELKVQIKDAYLEFDPVPIAAASLSQVHLAVLRSGQTVAVKVQRPGIRDKVIDDLNMLEELARFFDKNEFFGRYNYWEDKLKSFRTALMNELDFRKEAHNQIVFSNNLKEFPLLCVPLPVKDYTTLRLLTMEYISSHKITTLHPLIKMDLDGNRLAEELMKAYLKQIFIDGFVHIDPHPGNIYLTDTHQIALLDLGMVEHLAPQLQNDLLKMVIAISEGKGEEVADLVVLLGHREEAFEYDKFKEEVTDIVAQQKDLSLEELAVGKLLLKIARYASQCALRLPPKFNTLGKTLLHLDKIVKELAPNLNPNKFIQKNVENLLNRRMSKIFSEASFATFMLDVTDIIRKLPPKINAFLENLSKNELKLKVQNFDEQKLIGYEKIANRVSLGLVLSSLIVGGALLMNVQTPFQLFGYPGLAMIFFLMASAGGVLFILNILLDKQSKKP